MLFRRNMTQQRTRDNITGENNSSLQHTDKECFASVALQEVTHFSIKRYILVGIYNMEML